MRVASSASASVPTGSDREGGRRTSTAACADVHGRSSRAARHDPSSEQTDPESEDHEHDRALDQPRLDPRPRWQRGPVDERSLPSPSYRRRSRRTEGLPARAEGSPGRGRGGQGGAPGARRPAPVAGPAVRVDLHPPAGTRFQSDRGRELAPADDVGDRLGARRRAGGEPRLGSNAESVGRSVAKTTPARRTGSVPPPPPVPWSPAPPRRTPDRSARGFPTVRRRSPFRPRRHPGEHERSCCGHDEDHDDPHQLERDRALRRGGRGPPRRAGCFARSPNWKSSAMSPSIGRARRRHERDRSRPPVSASGGSEDRRSVAGLPSAP